MPFGPAMSRLVCGLRCLSAIATRLVKCNAPAIHSYVFHHGYSGGKGLADQSVD